MLRLRGSQCVQLAVRGLPFFLVIISRSARRQLGHAAEISSRGTCAGFVELPPAYRRNYGNMMSTRTLAADELLRNMIPEDTIQYSTVVAVVPGTINTCQLLIGLCIGIPTRGKSSEKAPPRSMAVPYEAVVALSSGRVCVLFNIGN